MLLDPARCPERRRAWPPLVRSASQWPGVWRSAAAWGQRRLAMKEANRPPSCLAAGSAANYSLGARHSPRGRSHRHDRSAFASTPGLAAASPAAPRPCLFICIRRLVALCTRPIAFHLPHNSRWRAIQSCSNLPVRVPRGVKSGQFTPLFNGKLTIVCSHGNTLAWCCTSFVSLALNSVIPRRVRHSRENANPSSLHAVGPSPCPERRSLWFRATIHQPSATLLPFPMIALPSR